MARTRTRTKLPKPKCIVKWRKSKLGWTALLIGKPTGHVLNVINLRKTEPKPAGSVKKRFEKALLTSCNELYVPR